MKFRRFLYWVVIIVGFGNFVLWAPLAGIDIMTGQYTEANAAVETSLSVLVGLVGFCGIFPLFLGIVAVVKLVRLNKIAASQAETELMDKVLELAGSHGGKLTVVETSTTLNIPLDKANEILSLCVSKKLADLQVSESGVMVYHFTQIIDDREKRDAETV